MSPFNLSKILKEFSAIWKLLAVSGEKIQNKEQEKGHEAISMLDTIGRKVKLSLQVFRKTIEMRRVSNRENKTFSNVTKLYNFWHS